MDTIKCLDCTLSFHGVPMSTFIKFCTLKMCSLLYVSKLSLKVKKKISKMKLTEDIRKLTSDKVIFLEYADQENNATK